MNPMRALLPIARREATARLADRSVLLPLAAAALGAAAVGILWALLDRGAERGRGDHTHAPGPRLHLPLDEHTATAVSIAIGIALVVAVLLIGPGSARGAVLERRTRLADVLGPRVGPGRLLVGRVLGDTAAATVVLLALATAAATGPVLIGRGADLAAVLPAVVVAAPFCVLALAGLFAVLCAGAALLRRDEDAMLAVAPVAIMAAHPSVQLALIGAHSGAAEVQRWLPLSSAAAIPVDLLHRGVDPAGALPQVVAPLAVVVLGTLALIALARAVHVRVSTNAPRTARAADARLER